MKTTPPFVEIRVKTPCTRVFRTTQGASTATKTSSSATAWPRRRGRGIAGNQTAKAAMTNAIGHTMSRVSTASASAAPVTAARPRPGRCR